MKVAIILGHRLNDDGSFSEILQHRMNLALRLYEDVRPSYIIVSGGMANPISGVSEAQKMYDFLVSEGIPEEKIVRETSSLTTKENAKYSVPMAIALNATTLVLCTSKEHMNRWYLNPFKLFLKVIKKHNPDLALVQYTG
jgi:uncharacterized SAM-binding protein YcdF (DUF218 family)